MKRLMALLVPVIALVAWLAPVPAVAQTEGQQAPNVSQVVTPNAGWEWGWEWGSKIPCDKTAKMCKTAAGTYVPNATPDGAETAGNGFAMGVLPNYWTLCVANGYGPTVGGPVLSWNQPPRALTIALRNVCVYDYSITNRMTIDNINNAGACIQYSNLGNGGLHQHWGPYYYIWNQNPVIWINTRSGCNGPGQIEHNAGKGVGYILGLAYGTCNDCIMGPDNNLVTRATWGDGLDADQIYQKP
jgi:hypothetical protein